LNTFGCLIISKGVQISQLVHKNLLYNILESNMRSTKQRSLDYTKAQPWQTQDTK